MRSCYTDYRLSPEFPDRPAHHFPVSCCHKPSNTKVVCQINDKSRDMNFHQQALIHSGACLALLNEGRQKEALRYCIAQHIAPPSCLNAAGQVDVGSVTGAGIEQLGDYGWWLKRLKISAKREQEKHRTAMFSV